MADGIYYYDETAPLSRSHDDVLRYKRSERTPASYLVELPGTLPSPPPEHKSQVSRRGTSIVKMDGQPSLAESEELEPLEAYVRENLPSFRKSLAPDDLKGAIRARGSSLDVCRLADGRCEETRRPHQNEKIWHQTALNVSLAVSEVLSRSRDVLPATMDTRGSPELVCSSDVCQLSPSKSPTNEGLRKKSEKETQTDSEMRSSHSDETTENEPFRISNMSETLTGNKKRSSLGENRDNVKIRQSSPRETVAVNNANNSPSKSENEDGREFTLNNTLVRNKSVSDSNKNFENKEIKNKPLNVPQTDGTARKEERSKSFDIRSSKNENHTSENVYDEIERNRANPTAVPMLTDPGGPENAWEPKWDPHCCPDKKRNSNTKYVGFLEREARPRDRKMSHFPGVARGSLSQPQNIDDLNSKDKGNAKREKTFEETRLKVDLMVELLDDGRSMKSRLKTPIDVNHKRPHENSKENDKLYNDVERVQKSHKCRSRPVNIRKQSMDRSYGKMGNERIRGGVNSVSSSSASNLTVSDTSKDFKETENKYLDADLSLKTTRKSDELEVIVRNNNKLHISRRNSLDDCFKLDDVKKCHERMHGGYDGKRKDQTSPNNKAGKPFSYDGMINCDIEDCPCRCHPDYDHSTGGRLGTARDRDYPDKTGRNGYDPSHGRGLDGKGRPMDGRSYTDEPRGKGYDPTKDRDPDGKNKPGYGRGTDYSGKGYGPYYDGDPEGRGSPSGGRGRDYPGKGYDPRYDGDPVGKGRPRDDRGRDYPGKGFGPDGTDRPRDGRDRDYPVKGYDPRYDGGPDGKGRPRDWQDRDYPGKGYDPDGTDRPRDGRGRDYPGKGYDPRYDYDDPDGKGRPRDGRDRDYPGKGYDPDGTDRPRDGRDRGYPGKGYDPDGKGRPMDGRGRIYPEKGYDPLLDKKFDDTGRPRDYRDGAPPGKGYGPGDGSPYRGDPIQGDGRNVRGDEDGRGKNVLKQRIPKTATSLFTYKRYHIQIPDHDLKDPWFNARFSVNKDKSVDLKYQGPVKINNYYTSNQYE